MAAIEAAGEHAIRDGHPVMVRLHNGPPLGDVGHPLVDARQSKVMLTADGRSVPRQGEALARRTTCSSRRTATTSMVLRPGRSVDGGISIEKRWSSPEA